MSAAPTLDLRPAAPAIPHAPANVEAEQMLLGAILWDNAAYERIDDGLLAEHFFEPFHQHLFTAIETAIRKGHLAEPYTLVDSLQKVASFEEMGGMLYLADLVDRAPPAANARDYARIVQDMALRRRLLDISAEAADAVVNDMDLSARDHIEHAEQQLYALAENKTSQGVQTFATAVANAVQMAAEAHSRDGGLSGLSTSLSDLDQKLGGLHPSDLIILAARPSMGKAQPLGSKVLMRDGTWRRMGDLRMGDDLASVDGASSRVAGVFPQGERQVYRVTFSDGRSAQACGEHLWAVDSTKFNEPQVLSTDTLRQMLTTERYQRRITLPLASGHYGADTGLLIDPWLLGALIGNGSLSSGHMSISTADAATLNRVQKVVGYDFVTRNGDYDYALSDGADGHLRDDLRTLGLYGKTSADKFIPPAYLAATRESRLELLRGLLDTDGWVETFGVVRYGTVSLQLAQDVAALVRSLGGICTIKSRQPHYRHKGELREGLISYTCNIRHPDRASLISLKRKQRRCDVPVIWRKLSIVAIKPEEVEPVQCIRVTHPSSLYITDDYVVTHNTALAGNIAFEAARKYRYEPQPDGTRRTIDGGVVLFFSLEMSAEQLALRLTGAAAQVSSDKLRKGEIDHAEFGRFRDASIELSEIPLYIDDTGGLSLAKLTARARRQKRTHGLDLIVVDYLQLIDAGIGGKDNRVQQVSFITQGLKALAKELSVPVLALSQLSRQVENREDKKPQLSDLRESGSIEQDADMVIFLYREEYYLERLEPKPDAHDYEKWRSQMDAARGTAEAIVSKQRHGPIGTVRLAFQAEMTRFSNLAQEDRLPVRRYGDN